MITTTTPGGFYGRQQELAQLRGILSRQRWFFVQVAGRRRIRFGTCKRNPAKLINSLPALRAGAAAFLAHHAHYAEWQVKFCAIAPQIPQGIQAQLQAAGVIAQPLQSLLTLLTASQK